GTFLGFRCGRDVWFLVISVAPPLASASPFPDDAPFARSARARASALLLALLVLAATALRRGLNETSMREGVANEYPVRAAHALAGEPGPVFNDFDWGGFLIFALDGKLVS